MSIIHVTLEIGMDATDPNANDATVDYSDTVMEMVSAKFSDITIVERDSDRILLTATIDIANPKHIEP